MVNDGAKAEITTTDPRALEREVELRRAQLAGTIDELSSRLAPSAIKERGIATVKQKVSAFTTAEDGSLRVERVGAVAAAVVGITVLLVVRAVRKRR
ncbi:DUF3618 domain-containing protein [Kineococcus rubinsiae]|uniref:DUF3618 domain-containing protein n=1 Tax=Kineococcus rubinsiae TaxID=2609562 RepID=UPI001FCC6A2E|nr:DUF3618 domain-containing protein [Kineococcus rubinsiae]